MDLLEFNMELDIWYYLEWKNMVPFRNLISVKCGITYVFPHNYARIKFNSYYYLPLEKIKTTTIRKHS